MPRTCTYPDCERPRYGSTYCQQHYKRSKAGSDMAAPLPPYVPKQCSVADCDELAQAKSLGEFHYKRSQKGTDLTQPKRVIQDASDLECAHPGCDRERIPGDGGTGRWCPLHHSRHAKRRDMDAPVRGTFVACSVEGCERKRESKGLCQTHYTRFRKQQDLTAPIKNQPAQWRVNKDGYVIKGKTKQHREVMAEKIGRPLLRHETPHHKNGVRHDNRPENLELWSTSQPAGQRAIDKLEWAKEIIALYGGQEGVIS